MELYSAAGLINGVVALSFGLLVISKNWRERSNQIFFFMTIFLAVWSLGYWQWLKVVSDKDEAFYWVRLLSFGSLFIPLLFYQWVLNLFKLRNLINSTLLFL